MIATGLSAVNAQTVLNCADFWVHPDVPHLGGEDVRCVEYDPSSLSSLVGPGRDYRIFYPHEWVVSMPPGGDAFLAALADSLETSVDVFNTLLSPFPMYLVISEFPAEASDPPDTHDWFTGATAAGVWAIGEEPCPIVTHPVMRTYDGDEVRQIIAHEVFHCLQAFHLGDRMDDGPMHNEPADADHEWPAQWWVEGSAEYFSGVAYPCVNSEHDRSFEINKPVFRQTYSNVFMFHYFGEATSVGRRGIVSLLRDMPATETWLGQRAAFAAFPNIENLFHGFALALFGGEIPDCAPPENRFDPFGGYQVVTPDAAGSLSIEVEPFTISAKAIEFEAGYRYRVSEEQSGSPGRYSAGHELDVPGAWQSALPDEITAPCNSDTFYNLIATSTADSEEPYTIRFDFEREDIGPCEPCIDTGEHDACLIGQWELEISDAESWIRQFYATTGTPHLNLVELTGKARFRLRKGGTVEGRIDDWQATSEFKQEVAGSEIASTTVLRMSGQSRAKWSTSTDGLIHVCPESERFAASQTTHVASASGRDLEFTNDIPMEFEGGGAYTFSYTCSRDQAVLGFETPDIARDPGPDRPIPDQTYRFRRVRN